MISAPQLLLNQGHALRHTHHLVAAYILINNNLIWAILQLRRGSRFPGVFDQGDRCYPIRKPELMSEKLHCQRVKHHHAAGRQPGVPSFSSQSGKLRTDLGGRDRWNEQNCWCPASCGSQKTALLPRLSLPFHSPTTVFSQRTGLSTLFI